MSAEQLAVIKHGTSSVQESHGIGISQGSVNIHVMNHVLLRMRGIQTVEVASGAVVAGKEYVLAQKREIDEFSDDELAAFGTRVQISHWSRAGEPHGLLIAQALATHKEIDDEAEGKKIIDSIRSATQKGILTVVNENPVADDSEMKKYEEGGADNDWMASHLAIAIRATHLLLLTNKDGVEANGSVLEEIKVAEIPDILKYCGGVGVNGTGGMASKVEAAGKAAKTGMSVVIGNAFGNISALLDGETGTRVVQ